MKKLKDFFYDKNDILVVLLIVAVAAFVIYTSINSIMAYPEQYANEIAATEATTTVEETTIDAQTSTEEPESTDSAESTDSTTSTDSSDEENQ